MSEVNRKDDKMVKVEEREQLCESRIDSKEIFDGKILHVIEDTVKLPNGNDASREVIRHVGAVCVIPVTDSGDAVVERQYRYPIDKIITEIPAGKLNDFAEDRLEAAKRELREETGVLADEWTELGVFYPAAAYSDEKITMYMAKGLHWGDRELDDDEFLNVMTVPVKDLVAEVMAGKITDSKTQVAILKVARLLGV